MKKLLALALPLLVIGCSNTVEIEDKITYKCGNEIITTAFFDDGTMMMVAKGNQSILRRNEAASGAKYENVAEGLIFWNKGDDNYLEIMGQGYPNCREIEK